MRGQLRTGPPRCKTLSTGGNWAERQRARPSEWREGCSECSVELAIPLEAAEAVAAEAKPMSRGMAGPLLASALSLEAPARVVSRLALHDFWAAPSQLGLAEGALP